MPPYSVKIISSLSYYDRIPVGFVGYPIDYFSGTEAPLRLTAISDAKLEPGGKALGPKSGPSGPLLGP